MPLENIEIIKNINDNKGNLIDLNMTDLFREYSNKNYALVLIESSEINNGKVYIKTLVQEKRISKRLDVKSQNLNASQFYEKIILKLKKNLLI